MSIHGSLIGCAITDCGNVQRLRSNYNEKNAPGI